ncbi:MAG: sulfatase-like hydrolase/transferase, partial [Burkholderiales bacterium]|nr:sulfatase-like hydrolase/transferase [Burkholderiales bacterium]
MNAAPLPAPRLAAAFAAALAATVLLWLPLTLLPIVDGLLFGARALTVLRDVALLLLLSPVPALALAVLGVAAFRLSRRWLGESRAAVLGWALTLLPLLWIVARQFARLGWQWLRAVTENTLELPAPARNAVLLIGSLLLLALLTRAGWTRALAWAAQTLRQGAMPSALLWLGALGLVAWQPPAYLPLASRPATASVPPAGSPAAPKVLLITLDAVAAADADACNPASTTMPALARFAQQATCFERFYTASNFTTAAVSTLETGWLPWRHHANQPEARMVEAAAAHSLPAQLRAAGWRTHSLTDNLLASPRHRGSHSAYDSSWLVVTGLAGNLYREWAARWPDTTLPRLLATSLAFLNVGEQWREHESPYRSEAAYALLDRLLAQEAGNPQPQFIWLHTLPPHSPYLPPPSTRYKLLPAGELERWDQLLPDNIDYPPAQQALVDKHRLRYRESLMAADAALGEALARLEASGWLRDAIVVIGTDHGESFEQGFLGHAGPRLHEPLIHGPLVVRLPGQREGRRVAQPVGQADLAPTLLDLVGAPPLPQAEGRSLRVLLEGRELPPAPVLSMALERQSRFRPLEQGRVAVIDGTHKLLLDLPTGSSQLFELRDGQAEQTLQAPARQAELEA